MISISLIAHFGDDGDLQEGVSRFLLVFLLWYDNMVLRVRIEQTSNVYKTFVLPLN